jgi:Holliday junction DNA helicase RuvA
MISYLKGKIIEKKPGEVVIDINGVGYKAYVPLSTYFRLGSIGESVSLFVSTFIKEESINLYGFLTKDERSLFERLTKINGVGPRLALNILSGLGPEEFAEVVEKGEAQRLYSLPGVGRKTAMRVILELSGKLGLEEKVSIREDILSALINLGYKKRDVIRTVDKVLKKINPEDGFEKALKEVLKELAKK